ncbi:transferrin-like [Ctenocephalides felis]|uniref:transferrin-like n=1 Tax=Ctenocephalides felis TaxID=7515 RepID=UPI000E6E2F1A|nr:transferrin-like [Ctenocephalides felis]
MMKKQYVLKRSSHVFNNRNKILLLLLLLCFVAITSVTGKHLLSSNGKYRVCVVESRGAYKKANKFCPTLDKLNAPVECILGADRLDCLRRIGKGVADFAVFSAEDLVAARWSGIDILVTNEMRFHNLPFEYEVVAVVNNDARISTVQDLKGSRLCHPGHGYEADWNDILANYFENSLVQRQCDPSLSLAENRIKSSSMFFSSACKAGPWVTDIVEDRELKKRYPSLCSLCYSPSACSAGDKFWGRRGPLFCLTDGQGEVAWVRLDDVQSHFGYFKNSLVQRQCDPSLSLANKSISICTSSTIALAKCTWMQESAAVQGVEPDVQCIRKMNDTECVRAVAYGEVDVTIVQQEDRFEAERLGLQPILFEYPLEAKHFYRSAFVVRSTSDIHSISGLKNKRVCFASNKGSAWFSALDELRNQSMIQNADNCNEKDLLRNFFSELCIPGSKDNKLCGAHQEYIGEEGAFRCLAEGKADVAVMGLGTVEEYTDGSSNEKWARYLKSSDFRSLCRHAPR